ncbi:oligosaccharide flippase family protein [Vibrio vulnificus]|uniref:oligosaccharide flippase family protein n=1 Tax=Vibrio vulnificus TaxID=672 RepID=UPI0024DFA6D0|nr:oligosaccharide flippase family protein [Vibrio vulnificus]MDK2678967.1 oligosaccharide flippase family protein [Vibrio vulnificus]MDK2687741.1 oligosaccharide flippase family protein [Vibrio vulnificus]
MLGKNIFANYICQAYVALLGIIILPTYITYMGTETYGLIGFFTLLQAWFGLLDLGLTPTISRETARYYSGRLRALQFRKLYRALSIIFVAISMFSGSLLLGVSEQIATNWLTFDSLDTKDVIFSVQVMIIGVSFRWMGGLYKGVITGAELIVWLSVFNVLVASFRFLGVFVSMFLFGFTAKVFFIHQLVVIILELMMLYIKCYSCLPRKSSLNENIGWSIKPILSVLKFSLIIAFTSSIWILVTQTDKLILSGILSLTEYGFFSLAVLVASAVLVSSAPVSTALMPRLVRLWSDGEKQEFIRTYRGATQLVSIISGSVAFTFAFSAESLLFAWTGDRQIAIEVAPILRLYAIGNGFLVLAAFPYYLQYALGNLKYHFIGNAIVAATLVPSIIYVAQEFGAIGAAWVWLSLNVTMFVFWVWYVHNKLFPTLHSKWIVNDVAYVLAPIFIFSMIFSALDISFSGRFSSFLSVLVFGSICLVLSTVFSSQARKIIENRFLNG